MGVFGGPGEVYNHLNEAHGGAFEVGPDDGALAQQQAFDAVQRQRDAERRHVEVNVPQAAWQQIVERRNNNADMGLAQRGLEAYQQGQAAYRERQRRAAELANQEALRLQHTRLLREQQEERRLEYQRAVDRRQEEIIRQAQERRKKNSWCVMM